MKPVTFITPRILHDGPLLEAKSKASFNFDEYAVTLARLIADINTQTPFTLGISGAWGSGKTTLLRRLQSRLDETLALLDDQKPALLSFFNPHEETAAYRPCRTVWFNAWKYAGEDQLLVALIRVIIQAMSDDDLITKVVAEMLDPAYPRRDVIATVLGWFSIKLPGIEINPSTGDPKPTPFAEKTALLDLFDDAFDRLLAAWVHRKLDVDKIDPAKGVLVVFIDDLDRCLPARMIQVLEAVKLFMDKPGCIFVLGADRDIIQAAVEKVYADAGVRGQTASDYLEKVVQLRFNLPPIPENDMDQYVSAQVSDPILRRHWKTVALGAESNPRKVKTFLNDLQLQWAVWQNTCQAQGVDYDDFVRWEVVMRSAPAFRRHVLAIEDSETRQRLLDTVFAWALGSQGGAEAVAGFSSELNEQLRRVLKDIAPHQAHFTPAVIDRLIYLAAAAPPPEQKEPLSEPAAERRSPPRSELERLAVQDIPAEPSVRPWLAPGGHEVFEFAGLPFVKVPAGPFLMGSAKDNELATDNERPQATLDIPYDYWMARYPLTNLAYADFKPDFEIPQGKSEHPVVNVTWHAAQGYIAWLNQAHSSSLPPGCTFQLPSEAEWEKAARGQFANEWPWGSQFDPARCNTDEGQKNDTTPVGAYSPQGDSPYGCADMAGNVWEWTRSLYQPYPYDPAGGREDLKDAGPRVLRGGAFYYHRGGARCAARYNDDPGGRYNLYGFRVVVSPLTSGL